MLQLKAVAQANTTRCRTGQMDEWLARKEGRSGSSVSLRDKGFTQISGRQALYNMVDKGILDAEKNGVLLRPNVIVQKKNNGVVKRRRRDICPETRKWAEFCIT